MQFWQKSVLEVGLIVCLVLCGGQAYASEEAQTDSLVFYVELLERDLAQCELMAVAREDSLQVRLRVIGWELEASRALEMKWYERPILHFLFGAAATILVLHSINLTL